MERILARKTDGPADFVCGLCWRPAWRHLHLCRVRHRVGDGAPTAPHPQYDFVTYLTVIYAAYAPTQLPIAIGEMLITGLALRHALRQRPEVLEDLNVWRSYATT